MLISGLPPFSKVDGTAMADDAGDAEMAHYETDDEDVLTQSILPRHVHNKDPLSKYVHAGEWSWSRPCTEDSDASCQ